MLTSAIQALACTAHVNTETARPPQADAAGPSSDARDTATLPDVPAAEAAPEVSATVCENLCKQQVTCAGGATTTLRGTVHAPTPPRFGAADPLYNVLVYVPNAPTKPFVPGVSCQRCETASGSPLINALTDPSGAFTLKNAPVGANIPLVIQIGRWRRQVTIPNVAACTETVIPDELTRLPRNQKEGDIPAIAIATGIWDPFDCTLRKIGIDEAEFTHPGGTGRVHVWAYDGHTLSPTTPPGGELMRSLPTLSKYDLLLLPCDDNSPKAPAQLDNLKAYTAMGGRVFLTDWSYSWLQDGGAFEQSMTWLPEAITLGEDFSGRIDTSFPKGMAFSAWLSVVGAARPMPGRIPIHDPFMGTSLLDAVVAPTQRWIYSEVPEITVQHLTFNTPVGMPEDKQCGRVVFSQFHVADDEGGVIGLPGNRFPAACDNRPMTPQEKALEFALFDLSSCVQPDRQEPVIQ